MTITEFAANGVRNFQIGGINNDGIFAGFGLLTAADEGLMSGMRDVQGVITAPTPLPGSQRVYNRGRNGYIAGFEYEAQPNEFGVQFEASDLDTAAFIKRRTLYTLDRWKIHADGQTKRLYQNTAIVLNRDAQALDEVSGGAAGFDNLIVWSTKWSRQRGDAAFQAAGANTLNGIANRVRQTPWGASLQTLMGDYDEMTWEFWSEFPITLFTVIGDGTTTALPLPYAPYETDVDSVKLFNASASGVEIPVTALSEANSTATVGVAPTAGHFIIGMMEAPDL